MIIIQGALVFDDEQDYLALNASYIFIKNGTLRIGSEARPYRREAKAVVTLHGNRRSYEIPIFGCKFLGERRGAHPLASASLPASPHTTSFNRPRLTPPPHLLLPLLLLPLH
jgi:hypothetical protein